MPIITPGNDPEIKSIVEELQRHPELALTRREMIKYVLAAPGDRARQAQALPRLDQFETIPVNSRKSRIVLKLIALESSTRQPTL